MPRYRSYRGLFWPAPCDSWNWFRAALHFISRRRESLHWFAAVQSAVAIVGLTLMVKWTQNFDLRGTVWAGAIIAADPGRSVTFFSPQFDAAQRASRQRFDVEPLESRARNRQSNFDSASSRPRCPISLARSRSSNSCFIARAKASGVSSAVRPTRSRANQFVPGRRCDSSRWPSGGKIIAEFVRVTIQIYSAIRVGQKQDIGASHRARQFSDQAFPA